MVLALTKPTIIGEPQVREQYGRDVMVVVDLSGSMAEQDFVSTDGETVNRLEATKQVLEEFVSLREGDRLGLILFGDAAFVQSPFTADHSVWMELLEQTDVAMAGPSTALGDAIGLSIKVFEESNSTSEKVVIILTDGNDTGSFVEPVEAAKVAAAKDIKIHMIAMGDPETVGEQALDMDVIERIAKQTGGEAFRALNGEELLTAYQMINELEPVLFESETYWPKESLHHKLLGAVVLIYLLAFSLVHVSQRLSLQLNRQKSNEDVEEKEHEHV